jgi:hypothetical protein
MSALMAEGPLSGREEIMRATASLLIVTALSFVAVSEQRGSMVARDA